ncbi:MAG: hypothetical protein JNL48_08660 [Acidobacteria bacterium]|nr:hypothetical protein [Acidobacteriota bacterium]
MDRETLDSLIALALIGTAGWLAMRRVLPGRRLFLGGKPPLPHLAVGARVTVPPARYPLGQKSRAVAVMAWSGAVLAVGCGTAAAAGADITFAGLALSFAIIGATMAFSQWFAGRAHIRVDRVGLHTRLLLGESTLRWNEVSGLSTRFVVLRSGMQLLYLCVQSPDREVAFPTSMQGAQALRATIEAATGQTWPPF